MWGGKVNANNGFNEIFSIVIINTGVIKKILYENEPMNWKYRVAVAKDFKGNSKRFNLWISSI